MNCNDLQAYLVDYLGAELEPAAVTSIEDHLRKCPACAAEVEGLRSVVATLDATRLSADAVAGMAASRLTIAREAATGAAADGSRPWTLRFAGAALRYAAMIGFAFYIGWWYRGDSVASPSLGADTGSSTPIVVEPAGAFWGPSVVSPQVAKGFEEAAAAFPRSSSFSRSLLAFSRR